MLKEVVDVLLIRSKFSNPTCFGIWLSSSGGNECLISYSSNFLEHLLVFLQTVIQDARFNNQEGLF
jgi:hypothetical protein